MVKKIFWYFQNPIFISAVVCGIVLYSGLLNVKERNPFYCGVASPSQVTGKVCSNPVKGSSGKFYSFQIDAQKVSVEYEGQSIVCDAGGKLSCLVPSEMVESLYPGKLYSKSKNGAFLCEIGEEVCLKGGLKSDGKTFVAKEGWQEIHSDGQKIGFFPRMLKLRSRLRLAFKRLMWSWGNGGGLILSLLCGSREYLEEGIQESFKRAGLSHILALSGMHLSFFGGLSSRIGKRIFGQKFSWIFSFTGICLFVVFVGFTPSLTRSFIFSLTMMLAGFTGFRNIGSMSVLSFVFLVHVVIKPQDMFQVSFLLSYGALIGILALSDILNNMFVKVMPPAISSGISASVAAQTATAPISADIFGEVMPVGIIASVVVSPIVSFFMTFSLASIALSLCMPFLSVLFGDIIGFMYGLISMAVKFFALCPSVKF